MKQKFHRKINLNTNRLDYSSLEKRELLAGDVQVSFLNGHLQLTGDEFGNNIRIDAWQDGRIRLTGSGTTFNGSGGATFLQGPVTRFTADLRAGNDVLLIHGLTVTNNFQILGGLGNDSVRLRDVSARNLEVDLGLGNDRMDFDRVTATNDAVLRVSDGVNVIAVNDLQTDRDFYVFGAGASATTYMTAGKLTVARDFWAGFGAGNDRLLLCRESLIGRNATFWMGPGDDIFAAVPERADEMIHIMGSLNVQAGAGNDLICLDENIYVTDQCLVAGGIGFDRLLDARAQAHSTGIEEITSRHPNQVYGMTMTMLELTGIDHSVYGGVKLIVDPVTFRISVIDASATISSRWSTIAQQAVRIAATGPTISARVYGLMHTAMYDAWSAYDPQASSTVMGDQLQRPTSENTNANKTQAMSFAAYRVLVDLFPNQKPLFDQTMLGLGFNVDDNSLNTTTPTGIGNFMAMKLLEVRHLDGSNQLGTDPNGTLGVPYSDTINYQPTNQIGNLVNIQNWTPEHIPINNLAAPVQRYLTPHWGNVTPFGIDDITEFRAPNPEPFLLVAGATVDYQAKTITLSGGSVLPINRNLIGTVINPKFIEQFEEVADFSANLTDQQKLIAEFWENGGGTPFPPGTWMCIGQYVSGRDNHSLDQDAKLFFALGNAVMNAGIATWETKLHYNYARPVRAIRDLGELGLIGEYDANLGGYAIDAWVPGVGTQRILATEFLTYQPLNSHPSPPFADYTSGHSSFSASAAEILRQFTGSDFFSAKATFEIGSSRVQPGLVPSQRVTLSWSTFTQASLEAGDSRMYGGIHFRDANEQGITLGRNVGVATWEAVNRYFAGMA